MARPTVEPASPSTLAPALLRWIAAPAPAGGGGDLALLVDDPDDAELDELPITARALALLLDTAADLAAEPHVALRLPGELPYRRYDAVALAARAASSPADVLRMHARWSALVFPRLEAAVTETVDATGARALAFEARIAGHPRGLGLRVDEYVLALLLGRARLSSPVSIATTAARPRDIAPMHAAFGTDEIAFGAERAGFVVRADDAERPLPGGGDPALVATAEQLADVALGAAPRADAFRETVAAKIAAALAASSDASADAIAALLHMSGRTLQRRLESEHTRFGEVLDTVREKRARALLADPSMGLAEVAYRSGFADLATFSRAFKRWTGIPPGAFRSLRDPR